MGDAPPHEGDGVGRIKKNLHLMVFRGCSPLFPRKIHPNLVVLVVVLVAEGLWGDGRVMLHSKRATW